MVHCVNCGKPIEKIPDWMKAIQTEFVCNNCPNRQAKNIAFVNMETELPSTAIADEPEAVDVEEVASDAPVAEA
jgi:hypothetical protein